MADELGIKVFGDVDDAQAAMIGLARTSQQSFEQVESGLSGVDRASIDAGVSADRMNSAVTGLTAGLGAMAGGAALGAVQAGLGHMKAELGASIDAASDLNETITKSDQVFGDNAATVQAWAGNAATNIGLSEQASLSAAATLADMFNTMELGLGPATNMSTRLVDLSADVASFHNAAGGAQEVLDAIRSGLIGESEPLRRFNVLLSESAVQAKAAELGLGGANRELNEAEKVQARYALILEGTASAQGDFAETSGDLANQQRTLDAHMDDLRATMGQGLLPVVTGLVGAANTLASSDELERWIEAVQGAAEHATGALMTLFETVQERRGDIRDLASDIGALSEIDATIELNITVTRESIDLLNELSQLPFLEPAAKVAIEETADSLDGLLSRFTVGGQIIRSVNDVTQTFLGDLERANQEYQEGAEFQAAYAAQLETIHSATVTYNEAIAAGNDTEALRQQEIIRTAEAQIEQLESLRELTGATEDTADRIRDLTAANVEGVAASDDAAAATDEQEEELSELSATAQTWLDLQEESRRRALGVTRTTQDQTAAYQDNELALSGLVNETGMAAEAAVDKARADAEAGRAAAQHQRHVDELTAAHDRLRGALNPVEAALDVFETQIRAGIPLTAEQTTQVALLGAAQGVLQQQINEVTVAQGLAAVGFDTQLSPAVAGATGLMVGGVGAAGGLHSALWALTRQQWFVDVVIRQSVIAVGSQAGGNDEPGGFLPGTQAPLPEAPPPLPSFDVDAWVADIMGDVGGGSTSSAGGGGGGSGGSGGAAADAAEEAGISLANQLIEAFVQSILDGEQDLESAVAFIEENMAALGISSEDLFSGLIASYRELREEIATAGLVGDDTSQMEAALDVINQGIAHFAAEAGMSVEEFFQTFSAAGIEASEEAAEAARKAAEEAAEAAQKAAEDAAQAIVDITTGAIQADGPGSLSLDDIFSGEAQRKLQEDFARLWDLQKIAQDIGDQDWVREIGQQMRQLGLQEEFIQSILGSDTAQQLIDEFAAQAEAADAQAIWDQILGVPLEALASGDFAEKVQAGIDELYAKLDVAEALGLDTEQLMAEIAEQEALLAAAGEAMATPVVEEYAATLNQVPEITTETLEQLKALFDEYPEAAADMLDDIVAAVETGALTFEQAMQLLADVPDETLRPALERMRESLHANFGAALLEFGPGSPEVQAILASLGLIDAALEGVGAEADAAGDAMRRTFQAVAFSAQDDALTNSPIMQSAMASMSGSGVGGGGGGGFGGGGGSGGASFGSGGSAGYIDPGGGTFVAQIEIDRDNHERFIVDTQNRQMKKILG